jgi:hypothetical protein
MSQSNIVCLNGVWRKRSTPVVDTAAETINIRTIRLDEPFDFLSGYTQTHDEPTAEAFYADLKKYPERLDAMTEACLKQDPPAKRGDIVMLAYFDRYPWMNMPKDLPNTIENEKKYWDDNIEDTTDMCCSNLYVFNGQRVIPMEYNGGETYYVGETHEKALAPPRYMRSVTPEHMAYLPMEFRISEFPPEYFMNDTPPNFNAGKYRGKNFGIQMDTIIWHDQPLTFDQDQKLDNMLTATIQAHGQTYTVIAVDYIEQEVYSYCSYSMPLPRRNTSEWYKDLTPYACLDYDKVAEFTHKHPVYALSVWEFNDNIVLLLPVDDYFVKEYGHWYKEDSVTTDSDTPTANDANKKLPSDIEITRDELVKMLKQ